MMTGVVMRNSYALGEAVPEYQLEMILVAYHHYPHLIFLPEIPIVNT